MNKTIPAAIGAFLLVVCHIVAVTPAQDYKDIFGAEQVIQVRNTKLIATIFAGVGAALLVLAVTLKHD